MLDKTEIKLFYDLSILLVLQVDAYVRACLHLSHDCAHVNALSYEYALFHREYE